MKINKTVITTFEQFKNLPIDKIDLSELVLEQLENFLADYKKIPFSNTKDLKTNLEKEILLQSVITEILKTKLFENKTPLEIEGMLKSLRDNAQKDLNNTLDQILDFDFYQ
ncbi:hypothetical protein GCM10011344_32680 [Dokdonia pacifica]|uniref:Uncharacterized protein n=1 Tax=Dokdonia pacifica TaxID=1627892 RepID=A0A239BKM2_9FLAO|nr:hypothetical protein [Dokdonia pacifica]GGG29294.1 hypothetical protein GCM10011344_32680 [Dokdonia pacifica]SNS07593.1 hypothetical protein SAMN06265376_106195 [Dokdonia pacifica]